MRKSTVPAIRLHLLGGVKLASLESDGEHAITITPKPLALLAHLAVAGAGERALQRDTLLALFWPELPAVRARGALRQAVFHLRRALGTRALRSDRSSITLANDAIWCDATAFDALLAQGDRAAALELYCGDLLQGFFVDGMAAELEDWMERERARLKRAACDACRTLADDAARLGRAGDAMQWARRATLLAPDDETAVRRYIEILARFGDRAGALRVADDFARYLAQEFGAMCSTETHALVVRLRAANHPVRIEPGLETPHVVAPEAADAGSAATNAQPAGPAATRRAASHTGRRATVAMTSLATVLAAGGLLLARAGHGAVLTADGGARAGSLPLAISSPVARRLYVEGLRLYYAGDDREAQQLLGAALAEDSTCAMCAYYLAKLESETDDSAAMHTLRRATRAASGGSQAERLLIRFAVADVANSPTRLAVAESLSTRYPNWPEAQLAIGQAHMMAADFVGAVAPLRRAIASGSLPDSGSGSCPACAAEASLVTAYRNADSLGAAVRAAEQWVQRQPHSRGAWLDLSDVLARAARYADARAALDSSTRYAAGTEDDAIERAQIEIRAGNFATADAMLNTLAQAGKTDTRVDALWYLVISLRNQGRLHDALAVARGPLRSTEQESNKATSAPGASLAEAQVLFELGSYRRAAAIFDTLAAVRSEPEGSLARRRTWNLTHAASAVAAAGDTIRVAKLADSVEVWGRRSGLGRDARLVHYVRGLLWIARQKPESAAMSFRRAVVSESDGYAQLDVQFAQTLLALGRPGEAIPVLRHAVEGGIEAASYYATRTEFQELLAEAFDAAGQSDSASVYYRRVVRAWDAADPRFQPRVARARARLAADERRRLVAAR